MATVRRDGHRPEKTKVKSRNAKIVRIGTSKKTGNVVIQAILIPLKRGR